jgi:hypothetical protein
MAKQTAEFEEFTLYGGKCQCKFFPNSHRYTVNGKPTSGSVTGIIGIKDKSGGLVPWAVGLYRDALLEIIEAGENISDTHIWEFSTLHEQKKQEAADIGTKAHDWVEKFIKGENPDMPEEKEVQIAVNAFLDWMNANKVKFISSERVVYSKKYDYIGKMDIEAKVNGKLCLLDIKTSNDLRNDYYMQTAAYVKADEEESGKEYHGRWLIRISKETEEEYIARMEKKNRIRLIQGKEAYPIKPYEVFEALFLDDEETNMDRDFKSFLACKTLSAFEKETGYWAKK